jgi:hypothetical protein
VLTTAQAIFLIVLDGFAKNMIMEYKNISIDFENDYSINLKISIKNKFCLPIHSHA